MGTEQFIQTYTSNVIEFNKKKAVMFIIQKWIERWGMSDNCIKDSLCCSTLPMILYVLPPL